MAKKSAIRSTAASAFLSGPGFVELGPATLGTMTAPSSAIAAAKGTACRPLPRKIDKALPKNPIFALSTVSTPSGDAILVMWLATSDAGFSRLKQELH